MAISSITILQEACPFFNLPKPTTFVTESLLLWISHCQNVSHQEIASQRAEHQAIRHYRGWGQGGERVGVTEGAGCL